MPSTLPAETRTLIRNVRWETFVALAEDRQGSIPRMTYINGNLELMSPKKEHETAKTLLGRMIHAFCDIHEIEILSVASTTFHREDLERGFEADEAYYVEHAEAVLSKEEIDLSVDPPPDIVIEIEITSSALPKMTLFASMGIAEVWRHNGRTLKLFRLQDADYRQVDASVALPGFPVKLAESLLTKRLMQGETALVHQFRDALD